MDRLIVAFGNCWRGPLRVHRFMPDSLGLHACTTASFFGARAILMQLSTGPRNANVEAAELSPSAKALTLRM
ncbi:MAG TPA: hypothetical protein VI390_04335, partial [Methyloceanibacter sp.]